MPTIPANKRRFDLNHGGKRYLIRLTDWAWTQLDAMAGRPKSAFLANAIVTFAAANNIHTDNLDTIFATFAADGHRMNQTDLATAAIIHAWTLQQNT